jgi:hypothetical protein
MKKTLLMSALLVAGTAFTSVPSIALAVSPTMEISMQEEKVKIEADQLSDPVKEAIATNESLKGLSITEAWQITSTEGVITYKVVFTNAEGEKSEKTYTADGTEITA